MAISALERSERRGPYPNTVRALANALGLDTHERAELLPGAKASLPSEPTRLLGRAEELAVVQAELVSADVRLLTLVGPGDVGKTRLAVAAAGVLVGHSAISDGVGCTFDRSRTADRSTK